MTDWKKEQQESKDRIIGNAVITFEIIGLIIEEGQNRGFKKEDTLQLISAGILGR